MSLTQSFGGTEVPCESDTITSVEFDDTGSYLAAADYGGRCVIFRQSDSDINHKARRICAPNHGPAFSVGREGLPWELDDYSESKTGRERDAERGSGWHKDGFDGDEGDSKGSGGRLGQAPGGAEAKAATAGQNGVGAAQDKGGPATGKGSKDSAGADSANTAHWTPFHQFQSHEAEFDYLKSLGIEAKVNQLRFVPCGDRKLLLLTTNDKTIKLWRMAERHPYSSANASSRFVNSSGSSGVEGALDSSRLQLPQKQETGAKEVWSASILRSNLKTAYTNAHSYHINSISLSADGDRFISADDLRINMWDLEDRTKCFTVVDRKPSNIEDLNEIITCSAFHPTNTNVLAFSTSKGQINLADLRKNAVCKDSDLTSFQVADDWSYSNGSENGSGSDTNPGLYNELMKSILDVKFTSEGRYIASRDYLSIKVWDVHMTREPVKTIELHSHLKPLLPQLYESESIFDKFTMNFSPCGQRVVTGGYNNMFLVHDIGINGNGPGNSMHHCYEGELPNFLESNGPQKSGGLQKTSIAASEKKFVNIDVRTDQRVVHCAWHPRGKTLAVAGVAGLHLFNI